MSNDPHKTTSEGIQQAARDLRESSVGRHLTERESIDRVTQAVTQGDRKRDNGNR